jgi:flagellar motor switch protein FliG
VDWDRLSGSEKAAVFVLSIPQAIARGYLANLEDKEVERILSAVARFDVVPPEIQMRVMGEFREAMARREIEMRGGADRARFIAEATLEGDRAQRILEHLGEEDQRIEWTLLPFSPKFIAETLRDEHPQTIALVLSQLPVDRGASVLEHFAEDLRSEIVLSLAELESVATEILSDLEEGVAELFGKPPGDAAHLGGTEAVAKLLNSVAKNASASILDGIESRNEELASVIRNRMLTFNDLVCLSDRSFQQLLREVPSDRLVIALRTGTEEIKKRIFANVSKRAGDQIREDMELQGPIKLSEVEKVQREIVEIARRLEAEGAISIELGGGSDVLV